MLQWLSGFLPLRCPFCGTGIPADGFPHMVCAECFAKLPFVRGRICPGCGGVHDGIFDICSECMELEHRNWTRAFALFRCTDMILDAVHRYKYRGHTEFARPFGHLAAGLLRGMESVPEYDWMTPIPLNWRRSLERGYNQSELFLRYAARELGFPCGELLYRTKYTRQQAFLTKKERRKNIDGAFSIKNSQLVKGRCILLADDVMTTGATLAEAAGVLLNNGAARVDVLVIARRQRI